MTEPATTSPPAQEKAPFITNDLKVLLEGTEKRIYLIDSKGVNHLLNPLNLADMVDFEAAIGVSIMDISKVDLKLKHILYLLYLSLRKEGRTPEDLRRRKFAYTETEVQEMFDLGFLPKATEALADLLSVSGFKLANPQMPTSPKDTTPESVQQKA